MTLKQSYKAKKRHNANKKEKKQREKREIAHMHTYMCKSESTRTQRQRWQHKKYLQKRTHSSSPSIRFQPPPTEMVREYKNRAKSIPALETKIR